jgi:hypothetical protein
VCFGVVFEKEKDENCQSVSQKEKFRLLMKRIEEAEVRGRVSIGKMR